MMDMEALLLAREERARLQEALLRQWGGALLVHRVNMPGPDKNSPLALQIFSAVEEVLEAAFGDSVRCARQLRTAEGPSGLRILDLPPELLKRQAVALEEGHPWGAWWTWMSTAMGWVASAAPPWGWRAAGAMSAASRPRPAPGPASTLWRLCWL